MTSALSSSLPTGDDSKSYKKVLLVEDHDLVRLGIKALFSSTQENFTIEWLEAATLADALRLYANNTNIDLVLLDLNLADCKGLSGFSKIKSKHPYAKVVILSGTQDEFVVRQAQLMGAVGYLHKSGNHYTMAENLRLILNSDLSKDSLLLRSLQMFPSMSTTANYERIAGLGTRHLEILELVLSGCSNQEIGNTTHLSVGTVKNYMSTILHALDVKSRSHLISLFR
jgi:DNA-binding NarL/FixJ family response regulator